MNYFCFSVETEGLFSLSMFVSAKLVLYKLNLFFQLCQVFELIGQVKLFSSLVMLIHTQIIH